MQFNMGYLVGEKEVNLKVGANEKDLERHISDIMPNPEEFASLGVKEITFDGLGNASASSTEQDWETYRMQLRFTIHHDVYLTTKSIQQIVGAIYENGANASYTPDSDDTYPYTFMYPYHTIHDIGEADTSEADDLSDDLVTTPEEDADVYTPCPPRRNTQYNCSPAFVTCDGEYQYN